VLHAQSKRRYVSAYAIALVHAGVGDKDEALRYLNLGLKERTNWMVWTAVDPRWEPVKRDARFQQLLGEMGL
jgi:hypothetical protein